MTIFFKKVQLERKKYEFFNFQSFNSENDLMESFKIPQTSLSFKNPFFAKTPIENEETEKIIFEKRRISASKLVNLNNENSMKKINFYYPKNIGLIDETYAKNPPASEFCKVTQYKGFCNLGNTCYLNSFLQALFLNQVFRNELLLKKDNELSTFTKELKSLFKKLVENDESKFVNPVKLKQKISYYADSYQQEDPSDLLKSIIHECLIYDNEFDEKLKRKYSWSIIEQIKCSKCFQIGEVEHQHLDIILQLSF